MRIRLARAALAGIAAGALGLGAACAPPTPTPAPSVTVSPGTGLVDGQQVTVSGSGYNGDASVGLVQCPAGATSQDLCDGRTATSFSADAHGRFVRRLAVVDVLTDAHGTVTDCGAAPGACVVAGVYIHGFAGLATAPLAFG